ncbi:hypothetical protein CP533_2620 [Ophiocordyceps camponoti-saundersi (nom. inval.)]|nr:hypothetical protein CP533_2620 [Ophiocordyceps camponoti-saundersi (nom. inval.)]
MKITSLLPLALLGLTVASPMHPGDPQHGLDKIYSLIESKTRELQGKIESLPPSTQKANLQVKLLPLTQRLNEDAKKKSLKGLIRDGLSLLGIAKDKGLMSQLSQNAQVYPGAGFL